MAVKNETMVSPSIETLLGQAESKFRLVTLASKRARQINSYYGQLGDGLGAMIPAAGDLGGPQTAVHCVRRRSQPKRSNLATPSQNRSS